jgi:hypothetical protein
MSYKIIHKPFLSCCGRRVKLPDPPKRKTWEGRCDSCKSIYIVTSRGVKNENYNR